MGENRLMADLYEENQRLKERIKELEEKHFVECTIISQYDDELKALLSKVDIGAAKPKDYLDLLDEWAKARELLKAAVEDLAKIPCNNDVYIPSSCDACIKQGNCDYSDSFKWRYADEALALIGEDGEQNENN